MVRTPCCKAEGLKKGAWTPEEDEKLVAYLKKHGEGGWRTLPEKAGLKRCGKSCRLRWVNYLKPDIKRGELSAEDEDTIIKLHALHGNKWSAIARHLSGRTDNEIKNYWNTHIKKRLTQKGIDTKSHKPVDISDEETDKSKTENIDHPQSSASPNVVSGSVSGSARLLNRAATKLAGKVDKNFLAGIIQGGTGPKNGKASVPSEQNSMLGTNFDVQNPCTLISTPSNSDDLIEISMSDSDSAAAIGPPLYCINTPSDYFQGVSMEINSGHDLDVLQDSFTDYCLFEFTQFPNEHEGKVILDTDNAEETGFAKEWKDKNIINRDFDDIVLSKEIGDYWDEDLDLGNGSLVSSCVFI